RIAHLLVHSDTAIGRICAELVKKAIPGEKESIVLLTAGGLRTNNVANFRSALDELTKQLVDSIEEYKKSGYAVRFNLSGGWKSVNAYLQGVAMILGIPCVFVFEGSSELLEIPRLPARLNADEILKTHQDAFRRLDNGYTLSVADVIGVPESLLTEIDGKVVLSLWGTVLWNESRNTILGEKLLPPLSDRLCFSKPAENNFSEIIDRNRRIEVQNKFDKISFILDKHDKPREYLARLEGIDLKELRGNPKPPSTHEIDLWHDGATWRAFVHFDGDRMICDSLGKALH
ncbi:MAG: putative CRISPR-associated protein, partial [Candidatus Baltobacteraceae bacterium]